MMGERWTGQGALFYEFSLERHVPAEHMLRAIDRFIDLVNCARTWRPFTARSAALRWIPSC